ncbi:hypothetical protein MA16_Dca008817 [Dendrobium catenatum]|uniref:Uncharacterized protein n=1 Tax=Dendrobium catenatum TaxID=906689 RepID=A0A2I0VY49_9ASPA|nr:hypothetical protein MA16_Dca008817 [Dendrobium catenatum]
MASKQRAGFLLYYEILLRVQRPGCRYPVAGFRHIRSSRRSTLHQILVSELNDWKRRMSERRKDPSSEEVRN